MTHENQADLGKRLLAAIRASENASSRVGQSLGLLLGLNRTDGHCLDIVDQRGAMTAGELAKQSGLSTGAVTTVVDRLESAGYLRRVPDPADRRRVGIETTELTRRLVELIFGGAPTLGQAMAGDLSPEKAEIVIRFLNVNAELNRTLADLLQAHAGKPPKNARERLQRAEAISLQMQELAASYPKS